MNPEIRSSILIPGAILLAGIVISIAVYVVRTSDPSNAQLGSPSAVRPVDPANDHIVGNPSAPVMLIEYSDTDCEYCKQFEATLAQLMTEYGNDGKIAWVYRHFPVVEEHPNAAKNAAAAECASRIKGENAFWSFLNAMHSTAPADQEFDPADYGKLLPGLGIDAKLFDTCLADESVGKRVIADYTNGLEAGASGAPYTILLVKGKNPVTISGAVNYTSMKKIIEKSLAEAAH
ncbi:MAG: Na+/H+ antiporter NhaA type [Parcubacteria bacterium C7867-001]|nr:MAG: Na+/H+ antiporter NhaA type [Parcubacteria bacterium C7867-001]